MPESSAASSPPALAEVAASGPRRRHRLKLDGLAELLEKRADLRGAYPPADFIDEAIRWSA